MAEFTWTSDVQDGVLKNHTLSPKLREASIAMTKVQQFVQTEPGYGRMKGDSVTIQRIRNIPEPTSARLGERDRLPIDTFAQSQVTITVAEWGRGVEYTHKSQLLSQYNREDAIQKKLRQQLALVMDTAGAVAFKTAKIKFIPTSPSGGVFDTDGTPSTTAQANGTVSHIKTIRDYLFDTLHAPGYDGSERMIALASTKFLRGIRNDPEFLAWKQGTPQANEAFARGLVGSIENVDFVEVNHTQALANNKGSGGVLGEALIFGDEGVTMIVAEDPELRADVKAGDFGRFKAVAWYGVMEWGLVWDTANDGEARIVHVTSS